MKSINIYGARTNNLKDIDVSIKLNSITCINGPSGSGKSSLAFSTLFAESKKRFINSFSSKIKFFWQIPSNIDVDKISPVLPTWVLPQNNPVVNSRTSVRDILELDGLVQKLFLKLSEPICPFDGAKLQSLDKVESIERYIKGAKEADIIYIGVDEDEYRKCFDEDPLYFLDKKTNEFKTEKTKSEIVLLFKFRFKNKEKALKRLKDEFKALDKLYIISKNKIDEVENKKGFHCNVCSRNFFEELRFLSQISAQSSRGACEDCSGFGNILEYDFNKIVKNEKLTISEGAVSLFEFKRYTHIKPVFIRACKRNKISIDKPFEKLPSKKIKSILYKEDKDYPGLENIFLYLESKKYKKSVRMLMHQLRSEYECKTCDGSGINKKLSHYKLLQNYSIQDLNNLSIFELNDLVEKLEKKNTNNEIQRVIKKIKKVISVTIKLNISELKLSTKVKSLPPSQYQKLLLVKYLSYEGTNSLFILDEPSVGLDKEEQENLFENLIKLKKLGNTIIIVDHSLYLSSRSDELITMGPSSGSDGGTIIYQGPPVKNVFKKTYKKNITHKPKDFFTLKENEVYKIKNLKIFNNGINLVQGKSNSGKNEIFVEGLSNFFENRINGTKLNDMASSLIFSKKIPKFEGITTIALGHYTFSSRSSLGTYTGLIKPLRRYFVSLEQSEAQGLAEGHFSSNSVLGQCSTCMGRGVVELDMSFMENIEVVCDDCGGTKFKPFINNIRDSRFNFHEATKLPIREVFKDIRLTNKEKLILDNLKKINLDYLSLDRSLQSLSGGEKHRVKILTHFEKEYRDQLFVMENISNGLGEEDVSKLLILLNKLSENNCIIIVDENPIIPNFAHNVLKI